MSILVLTSDTLIGTPATGNIEYNGQFFGTDSNASRAQMQRITQGTAVASTSGTSIDFTGIPAWVKRLTVMFAGVSTSGTSNIQIQLGDSGGIENTGYVSTASVNGTTLATSTAGFITSGTTAAATTVNGWYAICLIGSNIWTGGGSLARADGNMNNAGGAKTLSDTLTQIRITTVNGTDTFDAGTVNIIYEG
jgi:hypothetical protein